MNKLPPSCGATIALTIATTPPRSARVQPTLIVSSTISHLPLLDGDEACNIHNQVLYTSCAPKHISPLLSTITPYGSLPSI